MYELWIYEANKTDTLAEMSETETVDSFKSKKECLKYFKRIDNTQKNYMEIRKNGECILDNFKF